MVSIPGWWSHGRNCDEQTQWDLSRLECALSRSRQSSCSVFQPASATDHWSVCLCKVRAGLSLNLETNCQVLPLIVLDNLGGCVSLTNLGCWLWGLCLCPGSSSESNQLPTVWVWITAINWTWSCSRSLQRDQRDRLVRLLSSFLNGFCQVPCCPHTDSQCWLEGVL